MTATFSGKVLALSGGVGGAKLVRGLAGVLAPGQLTVVANTGDDFDYWGLRVCPDIDSILYAMADLNDTERGWGRREESWRTLNAMRELGAEDWFQLGDQDLATHLLRSQTLGGGGTLTEATVTLARGFGLRQTLLPMSDQPVATQLLTPQGWLDFQTYFVAKQCQPEVQALHYAGIEQARPNPLMLQALQDPALAMIVLCPSNPFLSIDPILALPGCRDALRRARVPVVAVSPIIGGKAVKGPAAKMMRELALPCTATAVAQYYGELIDVFVIDQADAQELPALQAQGISAVLAPTLMTDIDSKLTLARAVLAAGSRP